MGSNKPPDEDNFEYNWIQKRKEVGLVDLPVEESFTQKFNRKAMENPLVPVGAVFTVACLALGLMSMQRGNSQMSQRMMRGRIIAQGFTVAAFITGIFLQASSTSNEEH